MHSVFGFLQLLSFARTPGDSRTAERAEAACVRCPGAAVSLSGSRESLACRVPGGRADRLSTDLCSLQLTPQDAGSHRMRAQATLIFL